MAVPNSFSANTQAKASEVNDNYDYITDYIDLADGHVAVKPNTSKLVKIQLLRQDITTDDYKANTVLLSGWGFNTGNGVDNELTTTVTFGITFDAAPIVVASPIGRNTGSDPSAIGDLNEAIWYFGYARNISTTSFVFASRSITEDDVITDGHRVGFTWIAVGELA